MALSVPMILFFIALTNKLQSSHSLLNIRNREDRNCFLYCSTAACYRNYGSALNPPGQTQDSRELIAESTRANPVAHPSSGEFDMPMGLEQIPRFEEVKKCRINLSKPSKNVSS